jgi:hypothetical protein
MDRIQIQASKLWDRLFADETAETYQNALTLTGTLIKESAQLIWLIICSVFVFGAWFSDTSVKTGKGIRTWVDQQGSETSAPADSTSLADQSKSLLDMGRTSISYLLNQAREQLGIKVEEAPSAIGSSATSSVATAKSVSAAPAAQSPSSSPTFGQRTATQSVASSSSEIIRENADDGWSNSQDD